MRAERDDAAPSRNAALATIPLPHHNYGISGRASSCSFRTVTDEWRRLNA
ncbi:MAG: hypothetical protein LBS03_11595 [Bacteroidales bacterium]|nr:hypothetical protein [Bacteroidales bacterium]